MADRESWATYSIEAIADNDRSGVTIGPFGSNLRTSDYRPSGVPLIFVRDIRTGDFRNPRQFVSPEKARELHSHIALPGDVLVTKMGDPPGDSCVYTGATPAVITADCIRIRPSFEFDPRFVSYALQSAAPRRQMEQITNGVAQRKMSLSRFRRGVSIAAPPLAEQRRIVDLIDERLARLDTATATLSHASARLHNLQERLVINSITGFDRVGGRYGSTLPDVGAQDGALPTLPFGWEWSRLGQVADVVGGVTKDSKKQSDPTFIEVPYLRVANVQRGHLDLSQISRIRVSRSKAENLRLQPGDVLLNEGGDRNKLARGWVWENQVPDCIHQNHVFRARINEPRLTPHFLSWVANTIGGRWAERNGKQSVNLASISLSMIRHMPVIIPPPGYAAEAITTLHSQLEQLGRFRDEVGRAETRSAALRRAALTSAVTGPCQ